MTSSPDVIVIGAGVLGLCTAAELAGRGHAVTVIDPGGPNASSVAAGMLAPALEALLEDMTPEQAGLLKRARDLWPAFAEAHGLSLHREGAEWRGPDAAAAVTRLRELGFEAKAMRQGLLTPDDWRIEPGAAMTLLSRTAGLSVVRGRVARLAGDARRWRVEADDGRTWFAPTIVLATGAATAIPGLPPTIAALVETIEPIRGQLTHLAVEGPGRVVRAPGVYAAPATGGVVIGATMEPGRRDLEPDPDEARARVAAGLALLGVEGEPGPTRVGIRGAVADGLPLAGPSGQPGLLLALAPRRNGWLLGPMVAQVVADGIEGRAPMADAAALDPLRLS
ncbi:FAD-binding oxidoreductase [Roseibacterium beibuensis]|uniref:NAD(P)/FAD-dependent oxidoreductase n=1 Tax=[Roseibacterium] beibuensis TaxID=1193142 RepID=UPI00217EDEFB|nr:FAD-dependent oxidoreductase [Roseibacterium beibuensis]MCS6625632.1 FAD-binding oxidoreductase [Roseibacterium beibuensis]